MKKLSISNYIVCAAALLALVALIVAGVSSSTEGYAISTMGWIVTLSIVAIIAAVASVIFSAFRGKPLVAEILTYVTAFALAVVIALFISARGELIGYIQVIAGPAEYQALNTFIAGLVLYLIAAVIMMVSTIFKTKKHAE